MKRVIIFLTALVVLFGLVGCKTDDLQNDINNNKTAISDVQKNVGDLKTQMGQLDGSLKTLGEAKEAILKDIDALQKLEKTDVEALANAVAILESDMNNKAAKSEVMEAYTKLQLELNALVSDVKAELNEDLEAIGEALEALATELNEDLEAIGEVLETLATEESVEELAAAVATLQEDLGKAQADLEALEARVATLEASVSALQLALTAAQEELATKASAATLAALATTVETLTSDVNAALATKASAAEFALLKIKVDELTTDVEQNADAIRLSEYKHATAILAADTTVDDEYLAAFYPAVEEEWDALVDQMGTKLGDIDFGDHKSYSYNAWMDIEAQIESLEANYPADRYQKLVESINAQRFFLGRDVTTDEIKARFAELAKVISELPTLEELFIEGVTELNEVTIYMLSENFDAANPVRIYADNDAAHEAEFNEVVFLRKTYLFLTSEDYTPMNAEALEEAIGKFESAQSAYQWLLNAYHDGKEFNDAVAGRKLTTAKNASLKEEDENETYSGDLAKLNELNADCFGIDVAEEDIDDYLKAFLKWCPEGYSMETLFSGLTATVKGRVDQIKALREAEELFTTNELGGVLPGFAPATATYQFNGTNFNKVNEDYDAVLSWASINKVDNDNRDYIYEKNTTGHQKFSDATLIDAYVDGLNAIYAEKVTKTEMIAKVTPTQEEDYYVEYTDKEELLANWKLFGDLKKAVNDFVVGNEEEEIVSDYGYGQTIANADYAAMLAKAELSETDYNENVVLRLQQLDVLAGKLTTLLETINNERNEEGEFANINLNDYNAFFLVDEDEEHTSVREALDDLYDLYEIDKYLVVAEDEEEVLTGNAAMSKAVELAYYEMGTAYNTMAQELADAVTLVNSKLDNPAIKAGIILYANDLNNVNYLVGALISNYKIYDKNIHVHVALTENEEELSVEVNFSTLADNIAAALANVATNASKAQEMWTNNAEDIAAALKVLLKGGNLDGTLTEAEVEAGKVILHLDDFVTVNKAYGQLEAWALEFLNPGVVFEFEFEEFDAEKYESLDAYNIAKNEAEVEAHKEYLANVQAAMIAFAQGLDEESTVETFHDAIVRLVAYVQTTKDWITSINEETGKVEVNESETPSTKYIVNANDYFFYTTKEAEHLVAVKEGLDAMVEEATATWKGTPATEEKPAVKGLGTILAELAAKADYDKIGDIEQLATNADTVYKYYGKYTGIDYTFTYHDRAAYNSASDALETYVNKYYRTLSNLTQLMNEAETQTAYLKTLEAYDLFYTNAQDTLDSINELLEAVSSTEAYKLFEDQLDSLFDQAGLLKTNTLAQKQQFDDMIANWNALFDNQEEVNCYNMFYRYNEPTNYQYAILRTVNMCDAVQLIADIYNNNANVIDNDTTVTDKAAAKTQSFTELKAVYDQYIRIYTYEESFTPDQASLNNYYSTFLSKVETMALEAE